MLTFSSSQHSSHSLPLFAVYHAVILKDTQALFQPPQHPMSVWQSLAPLWWQGGSGAGSCDNEKMPRREVCSQDSCGREQLLAYCTVCGGLLVALIAPRAGSGRAGKDPVHCILCVGLGRPILPCTSPPASIDLGGRPAGWLSVCIPTIRILRIEVQWSSPSKAIPLFDTEVQLKHLDQALMRNHAEV